MHDTIAIAIGKSRNYAFTSTLLKTQLHERSGNVIDVAQWSRPKSMKTSAFRVASLLAQRRHPFHATVAAETALLTTPNNLRTKQMVWMFAQYTKHTSSGMREYSHLSCTAALIRSTCSNANGETAGTSTFCFERWWETLCCWRLCGHEWWELFWDRRRLELNWNRFWCNW